ncbi:alpha/beta hydrolase [Rhodohalobacter sp. SW132]|uniref:alpha/beta fold hydrolase n=1 Tax=Rhodohalobacter sp. SW132 TaxID=2293433 RepID=UPI000E2296BF|nr:alpha/beta hydrolase [Rhodohalobacter sp. SW132]REL24554.1 alpha/beta hydrolase [Rhodohalobacter sp. SW132]
MEFISKRFQYNGAETTWYQKGEGKPLIILHGWGSSSDVMKPAADKLSGIRNCVLVDLPGFGKSPEPPEAWGIGDYADMVSSLVRNEFPNQPVDYLVHSFGGRIILKLLSEQKRTLQIEKVIITGGAGLKPKRSLKFHVKRITAKLLKLPVKLVIPSKRETWMNRLRNTALWKSLGSSDYSKLSGVMRETFVKSVTEFFDDRLDEIPDEILLLWGTDDDATPMDQARRLEKGLKNSALVEIENAGHYAFLDQPAKFTAISRAYLEG